MHIMSAGGRHKHTEDLNTGISIYECTSDGLMTAEVEPEGNRFGPGK
jgi:hypothetical protein